MESLLELIVTCIFQAVIGLGITYLTNLVLVRKSPVSIVDFGLQRRRLVAYGALMLFGVFQFAAVVGSFIAYQAAPPTMEPADVATYIATVNSWALVFLGGPLVFLVGAWMGRRSIPRMSIVYGALNVVIAGVLCVSLAAIILLLMASSPDNGLMDEMLSGIEEAGLWASLSSNMALVLVPALCGYLNGRRKFSGAYLAYLLRRVPKDTRDTIVRLAYEEAIKTH